MKRSHVERAAGTIANRLGEVELKAAKCELPNSSSALRRDEPTIAEGVQKAGELQKLSCEELALQNLSSEAGALVEQALEKAHITKEQAAAHMGISHSLFTRQLQNVDNQHLSLQRLFRLPNAFWLELWVLIALRRKLARVRRRVVFEVAS